jgi:hypothetical protein
MTKRQDDGSINSVSPKVDWPADYRSDWYPFDRATTFGVPLADVTDTKVLEDRLIKPLVAAISESRFATHP